MLGAPRYFWASHQGEELTADRADRSLDRLRGLELAAALGAPAVCDAERLGLLHRHAVFRPQLALEVGLVNPLAVDVLAGLNQPLAVDHRPAEGVAVRLWPCSTGA